MSDADDIARFLAEHGATRCPTAYLVETQAAIIGLPRVSVPSAEHRSSAMYFKDQESRRARARLDKQKKALA